MHVNNLGGARMPVTPTTDRATQTAGTRFSTLVQGGAGAPSVGRAGLTGSSVVASAISANSAGIPGFGAPYQQAMPSAPLPGVGGTSPAQSQAPGVAGSEFNGEMQAQFEQQQALKDLMKMSLTSFISTTFSMGQNRPKADDW